MKKSVLGSRFLLILLFTPYYCVITPGVAVADVPKFISFQGELTDSHGTRITSAGTVTFKIYNVAAGGSFLWSEAQTVTPANGIVSAFVGSQTTGGLNLAFDTQYWLGVTVSPDAEMSPRIRLSTSPYAFIAKNLDTGARAYGALAVAETVTASKFVGDGTLLTGIIGTAGPKGDTGATGVQGPKGDTGAGGSPGPKGDTGAMGAKGDTGAQGLAGAMGPQGDTGPQGFKGDTGATGVPGPKGDTGASGTQGLKGDTGATGVTGAKGDTGVQGVAGATGLQGDTGPQGLKGDTGATGSQGVKGDTGAAPFSLNGSNAYYTAGNVGIGDTTPGGKLVVKGNVIVRDTMTVGDTFLVVKENGYVGVGTSVPTVRLDVAGGIKMGTEATCDTPHAGTLRYNSSTKAIEYCDANAWGALYGNGSVPSGTWCGYYNGGGGGAAPPGLQAYCQGYDPNVSCPSGWTKMSFRDSNGYYNIVTCIKN